MQSNDQLRQRQEQWDAFHRWESRPDAASLSTEERVRWYISAYRLFRPPLHESWPLDHRITLIQTVRERLSVLRRTKRNG